MPRAGDCTLHHHAISHVVLRKKNGGVLLRGHDGMPICHLRALIHNMCGGNSNTAGLGSRVLRQNRWQPSDRTQLEFRYLSRPRWCTEQRRSGTSTAALHPGFTGARAESHGGATSHVPELLMVEWVYVVPQVRSSAEPPPAISPCQINCNRSLQTSMSSFRITTVLFDEA